MGLFVVAEEVDVDNGQAAGEVYFGSGGDDFTQADADENAGDDEGEFSEGGLAAPDAANRPCEGEYDFQWEQGEQAQKRGKVEKREQEEIRDFAGAPKVAQTERGPADMTFRLGGAARVDVAPRATVFE